MGRTTMKKKRKELSPRQLCAEGSETTVEMDSRARTVHSLASEKGIMMMFLASVKS